LSSSSPSSRQRFPSPHRSRGHRPFPSRNDQPPGDRRPRIGRRQRGVAVLASPAIPRSPAIGLVVRRRRAAIHRRRRRRADRRRLLSPPPRSYRPPPALFYVDCCFFVVASQRTPEGSWVRWAGGVL
jgi:hypothetical protein